MALSKRSVNTAVSILKKIAKTKKGIITFKEHDQNTTDRVFGKDKKSDGGWESVFVNIRNYQESDLQYFNERKREISNTPFIRDIGGGYTRIGWY